jgi:SNF2 family DNA or RNA helicase
MKPLFPCILICVPTNTLASWENEFKMWTSNLDPTVVVDNCSSYSSKREENYRKQAVVRWGQKGGVMLTTKDVFESEAFFTEGKLLVQPDVLIVDEAHIMVGKKDNQIFKALGQITTRRRILLTGTPFQNNLKEYYTANFIRKGIFGMNISQFDKEYIKPIEEGKASDVSYAAVYEHMRKLKWIYYKMEPYVQRKDATVSSSRSPSLSTGCAPRPPNKGANPVI